MAIATSFESLGYNSPDGMQMGISASDKIAFFGTTPVTQRAGASQATSVIGTASTTALSTAQMAYLIEIGNTLQALGLWKGAA
jgi:hypothetical protein